MCHYASLQTPGLSHLAQECWEVLCGFEGNPLTVAATKSVDVFNETLRILQARLISSLPMAVENLGGGGGMYQACP